MSITILSTLSFSLCSKTKAVIKTRLHRKGRERLLDRDEQYDMPAIILCRYPLLQQQQE